MYKVEKDPSSWGGRGKDSCRCWIKLRLKGSQTRGKGERVFQAWKTVSHFKKKKKVKSHEMSVYLECSVDGGE